MRALSDREAFDAMVRFLKAYYRRTGKQPEIGILLGELAINDENETGDPAAWQDWLDVIDARSGDGTIHGG